MFSGGRNKVRRFRHDIHGPCLKAIILLLCAVFLWPQASAHAAGINIADWRPFSVSPTPAESHFSQVQYYAPPRPPRVMRPHRPLPPRLRGYRPPRQKSGRNKRARKNGNDEVRISPSQALKRALRHWPDSVGLSVRLLRRERPVYVVRLRAGNQVMQVLVDATTGRVKR